MNLPEFLKQIDEATKDMTKEMLAGFVHERARMLPESQRDDYLAQIHSIAFMKSEAAGTEKKDMERSYTQNDVEDVLHQLEQIEEGVYFLTEEYNEEYDDWYHSDVPEILYGDPDELLDSVQDGIRLVHQCIDCEDYKNAYLVSEALSLMEVQTDGEYTGESLSLSELYHNRLIVFDNKMFILEALYSAYMANEPDERPDAIFRMFYNNQYLEDTSLEAVMQFAPRELPDFSGFIKRWIIYLGDRKGGLAERLFSEAIAFQNDRIAEIENARKYVAVHPGTYLKLLQENPGNAEDQKQLELGKEALATVDKKYIVRSKIALYTAQYALRLGLKKEAESCWLEAFRSQTIPLHLLRLINECEDYSVYQDDVRQIYQNDGVKTDIIMGYRDYSGGELAENRINKKDMEYFACAFLDGQFDEVMKKGMNVAGGVGWSGTFMKQGIALFLLYLYQGKQLSSGCLCMCRNLVYYLKITKDLYMKGCIKTIEGSDEGLFWNIFQKWREQVPLTDGEKDKILKKLEKWIRIRVEGIMNGNHRKYYGECASYIAALGEVRESRGEKMAKERLMQSYRETYSRRRAFHDELRAYGMKDTRKRR